MPSSPRDRRALARVRTSDARGVAQLATQAASGMTDIVEGVHLSVLSTLGLAGGDDAGRTGGLTGLIYSGVRAATQLAGGGLDMALAGLEGLLGEAGKGEPETLRREAVLAVLNGVMGDRLATGGSPFATPMSLRYRGETLDGETFPDIPEATGRILLLVHGLCMNDLSSVARHRGHAVEHGAALASALGYTPVYLRYNSGLHTSLNGRELSILLEKLVARWPMAVDELTVVAHSMGGLVVRSACHHAEQEARCWPRHLKSIVFLGTPHHGAPLERAGNWIDSVLKGTPYVAPFGRLARLRSAGVTDLRHGHLLDEDWQGRDRFHRRQDDRRIVPLPEGVACYAVAASTAAGRGVLADRLVGDGLVPVTSALGEHEDGRRNLAFAPGARWIIHRTKHLELLNSLDVTRKMVRWLAPV